MEHAMTSRVFIPYVLFFYSFIDVDARSVNLASKHIKLLPQNSHKETFLLNFMDSVTTMSRSINQDSAQFGATTTSSSTRILQAFTRPLSSRVSNELASTSEQIYKQHPTTRRPRRRRYILEGSKMRYVDITWGISVFTKKLTIPEQIKILEKAFITWAAHCVLTFRYERDTSKADIVVQFVKGKHGDKVPFDDAGSMKAHAFFPSSGSNIHFDDYENWLADPLGRGGMSLLSAAIHEIGHSLGLRHSPVYDSVMFPTLKNGKNTLDNDDIKGIQALYGKCTIQNVDAVVTSTRANNLQHKALVFKNEWVWDVDILRGNINPGYPKKIGDVFNGQLHNEHPFKVVFYEHEFNNYVFMNNDGYFMLDDARGFPVHKFSYKDSYSFFPFLKKIGVPDAAFVDPDNYAIYHFFKGPQYYKYNMNKFSLEGGYPQLINKEWPGVPSDLDAAFYNYDEKAYFFIKGNIYYKLSKPALRPFQGVLTDIFKNICPI